MSANALREVFLLTPLREGRPNASLLTLGIFQFLLTPLREGRLNRLAEVIHEPNFYSRPCGRGDHLPADRADRVNNFYSRPCGRGDPEHEIPHWAWGVFLLTPLREGRLRQLANAVKLFTFLLTPLREGRRIPHPRMCQGVYHFYSRPCGRGDENGAESDAEAHLISTHAPAGGATLHDPGANREIRFLLTPLREGRRNL